jgi:hypothetical protein
MSPPSGIQRRVVRQQGRRSESSLQEVARLTFTMFPVSKRIELLFMPLLGKDCLTFGTDRLEI